MNEQLRNDIRVAEQIREYDEKVKVILANKIILAHILAGAVKEFCGMEPEKIVPYIEGEPEIATVPVEPGLTNSNSKIQGIATEDGTTNEGVVTFNSNRTFRKYIPYTDGKERRIRRYV